MIDEETIFTRVVVVLAPKNADVESKNDSNLINKRVISCLSNTLTTFPLCFS